MLEKRGRGPRSNSCQDLHKFYHSFQPFARLLLFEIHDLSLF